MVGTLGEVFIPHHGTAVQVTVNQADPTKYIAAKTIMFQALPGNGGIIYVGLKHLDTQGTGGASELLGFIPKPASATTGPFTIFTVGNDDDAPSQFNLADFYVDASADNDGVLVTWTNG